MHDDGNNNLLKTGDLKFPNSVKNKPPELVIYILPSLIPACPSLLTGRTYTKGKGKWQKRRQKEKHTTRQTDTRRQ